jgi:hypothetical protein
MSKVTPLGEDFVEIDDTLELLLERAERAEAERDRLAEALKPFAGFASPVWSIVASLEEKDG